MGLRSSNSFAGVAHGYARDVVSGRIVAGKLARAMCQRHLDDMDNRDWAFSFSPDHANAICRFVEMLPHVEGTWDKTTIVLEPWQVFCLSSVFGWRRRVDGGRRFAKVYWEVARKNAKSTMAAAVALYCLTQEQEPAPYVFIGATTGAQALKVFHPCKKMVDKTPDLAEAFGLSVWAKAITEPGGGYIQTINAKGSTQDGHNPHLAIMDELHAHKDRALYDVMDSAFGARRNPLMWLITTAGFDVQGVCYEQRTYAVRVLEGIIAADHLFAAIYTLDEGDDPLDEAVWIKANPNLGASVMVADMRRSAAEATGQPGKMGGFLTKRLNVWTSARNGHVDALKWKACSGPVDLDALRTVPCWMGYDLGSTSDMTSWRLIWWVDGRVKTWGLRYVPEDAVDSRSKRNGVPYSRWVLQPPAGTWSASGSKAAHLAKRRLLNTTPGDVTDYLYLEQDIRWALAEFNVQGIGFDSWKAQDLNNRLMADGAPLIEVRQGHATLAGPMQEIDRLYLRGELDHAGDEVLAWCASNVVARADHNDNLVPSKRLSSEKIDDYAALLNAVAIGMQAQATVVAPSIYETRGLLVFG